MPQHWPAAGVSTLTVASTTRNLNVRSRALPWFRTSKPRENTGGFALLACTLLGTIKGGYK